MRVSDYVQVWKGFGRVTTFKDSIVDAFWYSLSAIYHLSGVNPENVFQPFINFCEISVMFTW